MDLVIMEWLVRYRFWVALVLVVLALLVYLGKEKAGWQGWRKFVVGNFGSIIGCVVRGVSVAIGFVLKKVPWKPLLIWGPWVVIGMILAFYGVENWRGARAWEKVRSEWEARGEKLRVEEFLPEPIPDEENFAKHPVVVAEKMSGARLYGPKAGEMAGFSGVHSIWRAEPDLGESVDVTLWLPVADRLADESASARRCLELMAVQEERMAGVAEAVRRPGSDLELRGGQGRFDERWTNILLFSALGWADAFTSRALLHMRAGNGEDALRDVETCLWLVEKMEADPLVIGVLVEIAIMRASLIAVWEGLREHVWTEEQLKVLEARLGAFDYPERGMEALRCEAAYTAEICDYLRDHRGEIPMSSDILDWMITSSSPAWWDDGVQEAEDALVFLVPGGWFDQIRATSWTVLDRAALRPGGVRATEVRVEMLAAIERETAEAGSGLLAGQLGMDNSHTVSVMGRILRMQGRLDQSWVAIGLERFRLRTGRYPERLEELAPRELGELPVDLVTGEALRYRVKKDGTPLIWSVGLDGDDDGGVPARQPVDLDWVWQYTGTPGQTEGEWRTGRKPRRSR